MQASNESNELARFKIEMPKTNTVRFNNGHGDDQKLSQNEIEAKEIR